MTETRSFSTRTMAVAIAAGVAMTGVMIPAQSSFSPVSTANAQEETTPDIIYRGDGTGNPGDTLSFEAPSYQDYEPFPLGTTFEPAETNPEWITVYSDDGSVTVEIPEDQEPGTFTYSFDVVTGDNRTTIGGTITVNEVEEPVTEQEIVYNLDASAQPGAEVTISAPNYQDGTPLPEGTEYTGGVDNPDWITVGDDGVIAVTVPGDQTPGEYPYEVTVSVPGEEPVTFTGTFTVDTPEDETPNEDQVLSFNGDVTVEQGKRTIVDAPIYEDGTTLPEGTEFTGGVDNPEWVTVRDNGDVVVDVPVDETLGDYDYSVNVSTPDGDQALYVMGGTVTVVEAVDETPTTTTDPDEDEDETPTTDPDEDEDETPTTTPTTTTDEDEDETPTTTTDEDDDVTETPTTTVSVTTKPVNDDDDTDDDDVNDDTNYDKKDPTNYGPKVNTGGNVASVSLLDKIKDLFS